MACKYAYKNATPGSVLEGMVGNFESRYLTNAVIIISGENLIFLTGIRGGLGSDAESETS